MTDDRHAELDAVAACMDLCRRCGATGLDIGHDPDSPEFGWWARAEFAGEKVIVQGSASPADAANALSGRLLTSADCRCGRTVVLTDGADGCRWELTGNRWLPGCRVKPVRVRANRGDLAATRGAMKAVREAAAKANAPRKGRWRRG